MPHPESGPAFEYAQITDQLFVGTNACCRMHFAQELLAKGVSADISLDDAAVDQPFGVTAFLWLPTPDHQPPSPVAATTGASMLHILAQNGQKTYVHCKNGHGRAPTLVAAHLIIHQGLSADTAMDLLRDKRPSVHVEPSQVAFLRALTIA
jgi:dual specificity MAP kinase phosphatase